MSAPVTNPQMRGGALRGGRFEVRTATMVDLISLAYDMESDKVLAGPSWLDWDRFDVAAKAPPATTRENLNLMLQKLLADRFQLVVHKDTKPMPAYALTAGKGKPKMKEASGSGEAGVSERAAEARAGHGAVCDDLVPQRDDGGVRGRACADTAAELISPTRWWTRPD